jgi:hypothetical protein
MEKKYLLVFRAYWKYSTNIYLYTWELTEKNEIDKIIENDFFDSFFDWIPDDAKFYWTFDL